MLGYSYSLLKCESNEKNNQILAIPMQGYPKYTTRSIILDFSINYVNFTRKSSD